MSDMRALAVTYLKQRTCHVHAPHLALQVIEHLIGVGRGVVAMATARRRHAVC